MTNESLTPSLIDLNRADQKTLMTLPGIGPALAARILRFREETRPFETTSEITAVPGISERTYRQFADRVTVSPPDAESEVEAIVEPGRMAEEEAAVEPAPQPEPEIAAVPQRPPLSEAEATPHLESPPPRPAPAPSPQPARTAGWRQLLWTLVSLLGGALFALLVLQSINGTLDIATHPRLLQLGDAVSALERRNESLNSELHELRDRLDKMEALSGRLQNAETDIQSLDGALATLEAQIAALEQDTAQIQETVNQIRAAADRFDDFLNGLRNLLLDTQGTPVSTRAPSPTADASPTPSATSEPAGTPEATRTPPPTPTARSLPAYTPTPTVEDTPAGSTRTAGTATP